ncbi:MAG: type II toxin-antitoxin system RelE/ParE family toxin [Pseudomonadota bacterium]
MSYIITEKARKDLDDIWYYIAKDKILAANKVEDDILEALDLIVETPSIGTKKHDLLDMPVRFWVVHNYYIIYNPNTRPLQILRIISSYRDIEKF